MTFWVRSLTLLGAMISISVGDGGLSRSEPNVRVTCGMRPMVLCLMRSESEVEFKALGFRSAVREVMSAKKTKKTPRKDGDMIFFLEIVKFSGYFCVKHREPTHLQMLMLAINSNCQLQMQIKQ